MSGPTKPRIISVRADSLSIGDIIAQVDHRFVVSSHEITDIGHMTMENGKIRYFFVVDENPSLSFNVTADSLIYWVAP